MKSNILIYIVCLLLVCACTSRTEKTPLDTTHGQPIGLVALWTLDENGAEQGTVPHELYEDDGYYIKFLSEYYLLTRIAPIDVGSGILFYEFYTNEGYHYYLKDISDDNNWLHHL